jgi:serine/threonine protein kinase
MKLADFGNVHFLPNDESVTRGLEGTVSYMSPEMRTGRYYNTKTDIWSFGITMLNVLFDNNTTFPNFELAGPWAARKFTAEQLYLSTELKTFMESLFLKAAARPSAKDLLDVFSFPHSVLTKASLPEESEQDRIQKTLCYIPPSASCIASTIQSN